MNFIAVLFCDERQKVKWARERKLNLSLFFSLKLIPMTTNYILWKHLFIHGRRTFMTINSQHYCTGHNQTITSSKIYMLVHDSHVSCSVQFLFIFFPTLRSIRFCLTGAGFCFHIDNYNRKIIETLLDVVSWQSLAVDLCFIDIYSFLCTESISLYRSCLCYINLHLFFSNFKILMFVSLDWIIKYIFFNFSEQMAEQEPLLSNCCYILYFHNCKWE